MKKIIEIRVENFECEYCGHEEYFVVDPYSSKRVICCDKCGKVQENADYTVVGNDSPGYTTTGLNEEERLDVDETLVAMGLLVCVLVFLFIIFVISCLL